MDMVWGAISRLGLLINESQVVASDLWGRGVGARALTQARELRTLLCFRRPNEACVCLCMYLL